jgi:predicted nuclease of restriction endonuclease-like (RecB) superfamily
MNDTRHKREPMKKKNKTIVSKLEVITPNTYTGVLEQLKADIQQTQLRAALSVTKELILFYWRTGKLLSEMISNQGWGSKTLEKLSRDIVRSFPDVEGFSKRNLQYMRKFAESYPDPNCATAVAQLPWGHNVLLLNKLSDLAERLWYAQQTMENGWSRSVLEMWIEANLYKRKGKSISNFKQALPMPQSDLAQQALKDPYNFGFLSFISMSK